MKHRYLPENEQGQAIVILAFAMIVLLAFAALAIDGGNAYVNRRRAQNAADAGALAGAHQLVIYLAGTPTDIRAAINQAAEQNGIPDSDGIPGNDTNDYVQAYYTDAQGQRLTSGQVEVSPYYPPPPEAMGVEVVAGTRYPTFIAGIFSSGKINEGVADASAAAIYRKSEGCPDYAVYGAGPSGNNQSVHETGSSLTFYDGGLYGGDGGRFNNVTVVGTPPPPVSVVSPCNGCQVSGTNPNYNAQPQTPPALYDITDYQPGGQYAVMAGYTSTCTAPSGCGNYHYYANGFSAQGTTLNGLYFVNGNVSLKNVTGNASIVTTGDIDIQGGATLTTFDQRFPVLFTTSSNVSSGAVGTHNPVIELHGFIYAPNGDVNMSGAQGTIFGAIYAKDVKFAGSNLSFFYDPGYCPPNRASVVLLK